MIFPSLREFMEHGIAEGSFEGFWVGDIEQVP